MSFIFGLHLRRSHCIPWACMYLLYPPRHTPPAPHGKCLPGWGQHHHGEDHEEKRWWQNPASSSGEVRSRETFPDRGFGWGWQDLRLEPCTGLGFPLQASAELRTSRTVEPQRALEWKGCKAHPVPPPATGRDTFHQTRLLQVPFNLILNAFRVQLLWAP